MGGKSYSKNESLSVNVKPNKTVWVTFVPTGDVNERSVYLDKIYIKIYILIKGGAYDVHRKII